MSFRIFDANKRKSIEIGRFPTGPTARRMLCHRKRQSILGSNAIRLLQIRWWRVRAPPGLPKRCVTRLLDISVSGDV